MNLHLSNDEATALLRALDTYLPELEFELARIKLERHRHDLVELDRALLRLRARLAQVMTEGSPEP